METRTRIVLLMHPKEYRRQKTGTGRLACLHLANSEILPGIAFDAHPRFRELVEDPANCAFLLYPSPGALNLSAIGETGPGDERPGEEVPGEAGGAAARFAQAIGGRRVIVFLVDATWACARAVLRESPGLRALPRLRFEPREPSRWLIKRQPRDYCLATIEAIHELLCALESAGLDSYPDKRRLLDAFAAMQRYQVQRAESAGRPRSLGGAPRG
jgi:DTW domain-containing protein